MATITIPSFNTGEKVVNGLNTYRYTIATTATHTARIVVTQPTDTGMTVAIAQNGSTKATATLPAGAAGQQGNYILQVVMNCTATDTVDFVLTSSTAADQQANTVKATLNVHIGSN